LQRQCEYYRFGCHNSNQAVVTVRIRSAKASTWASVVSQEGLELCGDEAHFGIFFILYHKIVRT
jgi:hypothetical protein